MPTKSSRKERNEVLATARITVRASRRLLTGS